MNSCCSLTQSLSDPQPCPNLATHLASWHSIFSLFFWIWVMLVQVEEREGQDTSLFYLVVPISVSCGATSQFFGDLPVNMVVALLC